MIANKVAPATDDHIIEVISQAINVPSGQIHANSHLRDDLYLDPVDILLLIIKLENSFNVYLSPDEAATIQTVKDVRSILQRHGTA